jgi:hypothetical protein
MRPESTSTASRAILLNRESCGSATNSAFLHIKLHKRTSYAATVDGQPWLLTWSDRNKSGTIPLTRSAYVQLENYRADERHHCLVTFHSCGSN